MRKRPIEAVGRSSHLRSPFPTTLLHTQQWFLMGMLLKARTRLVLWWLLIGIGVTVRLSSKEDMP